jgi:hypothetical protein
VRMLDSDGRSEVRRLQLYLTEAEAAWLRDELTELLAHPKEAEHFHIPDASSSRDLSCSIVTLEKLKSGAYTDLERRILEEK